MKIVMLDGYVLNPGDISWSGFEKLGEFACYDRTPDDQVAERIGDAEIVITNKSKITRDTLAARPNIRYIGVTATGYDIVDAAAAKERGIPVTNVPSYGTMSVAQLVFALLLEICHHVGHHDASVKAGRWASCPDYSYWDYPLIELDGKTMGIVGYGRIGRAVANIAVAMGMRVLAATRATRSGTDDNGAMYAGVDEVLANSDVVSLHTPLTDATRGMIDAAAIAKMRDGAILINTSRGPLVVEEDVRAALASGKLYHYAADVVSAEPIHPDNPLLAAPNCILTPHIAWAPKAARERLMRVASENLAAFLAGRPVNVVNA